METTGVYKAASAGDGKQVHLHGNKEAEDEKFDPTETNCTSLIYALDSAGGSFSDLVVSYEVFAKKKHNRSSRTRGSNLNRSRTHFETVSLRSQGWSLTHPFHLDELQTRNFF